MSLTEKFRRAARRQVLGIFTPVQFNFYTALSEGRVDAVRKILDLFPEAIDWRGGKSLNGKWEDCVPVSVALFGHAGSGRAIDVIDLLLERGADINAATSAGVTALHRAASMGEMELIAALIERGADPTLKDKSGLDARGWARKSDDQAAFEETPEQALAFLEAQVGEREKGVIASCTEGTSKPVKALSPLRLKKRF